MVTQDSLNELFDDCNIFNETVGKVPKTKHSKLLLKLNQHASTYRFIVDKIHDLDTSKYIYL